MEPDVALLQKFATEKSEAAFRDLVSRRIDFVYNAALRQVAGDAHLAEEVAQNVFLDLARKARALASRPTLTGWLYTSTRFAAAKALRSRSRRLNHETEAHAMNEILSTPGASAAAMADWNELRPVLDAAMHELGETDREAILLRYFEGKSLAEVGAAIGLAENSARMRVDRALEKLRERLACRGITSTATALGGALAAQPSIAAPAGLAVSVSQAALSVGAAAGLSGWAGFLAGAKFQLGVLVVLVTIGAGAFWANRRQTETGLNRLTATPAGQIREVTALSTENRRVADKIRQFNAVRPAAVPPAAPAAPASVSSRPISSPLVEQRHAVSLNLRQIAAARDMFIHSMHRSPNSLSEIIGYRGFLRDLNSVDGEDYASLDLVNGKVFSVTTASGLTVSYNTEGGNLGTPLPGAGGKSQSSPALAASVRRALLAFRAANGGGVGPMPRNVKELLPFFENVTDAADYVEWLESINWPGR